MKTEVKSLSFRNPAWPGSGNEHYDALYIVLQRLILYTIITPDSLTTVNTASAAIASIMAAESEHLSTLGQGLEAGLKDYVFYDLKTCIQYPYIKPGEFQCVRICARFTCDGLRCDFEEIGTCAEFQAMFDALFAPMLAGLEDKFA